MYIIGRVFEMAKINFITTIFIMIILASAICVPADFNSNFNITIRAVSPPSVFSVSLTPSETVMINWTIGLYADTTVIVRKPDSYPVSLLDGTEIYNSTSNSFIDGTVVVGNHYYYRAFSYNGSIGVYTTDFVGANISVTAFTLFDIRNIIVLDAVVPSLSIICTVENEGLHESDITVTWELTRTVDGVVLDTGSDTFAVSGGSDSIYSIFPSTTFVGETRIYFSGVPPASAFLVFDTSGAVAVGGGAGGGVGVFGTPEDDEVYEPPSTVQQDSYMVLLALSIILAAIIIAISTTNRSRPVSKKSSKK